MKNIYLNGGLYLKNKPENNPLSYNGLSSIHQLLITDEGMFLRKRGCNGEYFNDREDLLPISIEKLETEYIDLLTFMKEAEYIGKRGKMKKPSLGGDIQFCMRAPIVLYKGKEHMLIYSDINDFGALRFGKSIPVDSFDYRYVTNDWEFYGEQLNIYNKPEELYRDLIMDSFDLTEEKGYQKIIK